MIREEDARRREEEDRIRQERAAREQAAEQKRATAERLNSEIQNTYAGDPVEKEQARVAAQMGDLESLAALHSRMRGREEQAREAAATGNFYDDPAYQERMAHQSALRKELDAREVKAAAERIYPTPREPREVSFQQGQEVGGVQYIFDPRSGSYRPSNLPKKEASAEGLTERDRQRAKLAFVQSVLSKAPWEQGELAGKTPEETARKAAAAFDTSFDAVVGSPAPAAGQGKAGGEDAAIYLSMIEQSGDQEAIAVARRVAHDPVALKAIVERLRK